MPFTVRHIPTGADKVVEESIDGVSEAQVRSMLAVQGSVVLSFASHAAQGGPLAKSPGRFDVDWWCREFRTLLRSGMTAVEAIETLAGDRSDPDRARIQERLLTYLQQGQSLSRAMRSVGVFPAVLVAGDRKSVV